MGYEEFWGVDRYIPDEPEELESSPEELEDLDDWWQQEVIRRAMNFCFNDYGFLNAKEKHFMAWIKANHGGTDERNIGI